MVSIAEGGIRSEVWDRRVSAGGPRSLAEGIREPNRRGIVARQVWVGPLIGNCYSEG